MISLSHVRSVFVVLFVQLHGVMSRPGAQEDIRVGGGCSFFTPGIGPESPAAVPELMGFVERAKGQRGRAVHRVTARLLPDGSGYE